MTKSRSEDRTILKADRIGFEICDFCSAVHVNFYDPQGRVFASAFIPAVNGAEFIEQFQACLAMTGVVHPAPQGRQ